jgi:hypothetical protein
MKIGRVTLKFCSVVVSLQLVPERTSVGGTSERPGFFRPLMPCSTANYVTITFLFDTT